MVQEKWWKLNKVVVFLNCLITENLESIKQHFWLLQMRLLTTPCYNLWGQRRQKSRCLHHSKKMTRIWSWWDLYQCDVQKYENSNPKPASTGFENRIIVYINIIMVNLLKGRFPCWHHDRGRKLPTCRFGENRRSRHHSVQKLVTASWRPGLVPL